MHRSPKKSIALITVLLFTVIVLWYITANFSKFKGIKIEEPIFIAPVVFFIMLSILCQGIILDLVLRPHGIKLNLKESFGLSSITRFGNYISTGYIGTAIRAVFLKQNYGVSIAKFSAGFLLSNIIYLIISGLLTLTIFFFQANTDYSSRPIIAIATSLTILFLFFSLPFEKILLFLPKDSNRKKNKVIKQLFIALNEYILLRKNTGLLLSLIFWITLLLLSSGLGLTMLYKVIGSNESFTSIFFISLISGWSMIFSITPANVGINEGLLVLGASLIGVSIPVTIAVGILRQLIIFITVGLLAAYFTPRILNVSVLNIGKFKKISINNDGVKD